MAAHQTAERPHRVSTTSAAICSRRVTALSAAVELGVDQEDFTFQSEAERRLWQDLHEEFQAFVAKIGPVWIAD